MMTTSSNSVHATANRANSVDSKWAPSVRGGRRRRSDSRRKTATTRISKKKIGIAGSRDCAKQVVPSFPIRSGGNSTLLPPRNVGELPDDLQLLVLSFLDVQSVRSFMAVDRKSRRIALSDEAGVALWRPFLASRWPWLAAQDETWQDSVAADHELVDAFKIPIAAAAGAREGEDEYVDEEAKRRQKANLSLLLSLAAETKCTKVDDTMFPPVRWATRTLGRMISRRNLLQQQQLMLKTVTAPNGAPAVEFVGAVGLGDRCVRADNPLPRPERLTKKQKKAVPGGGGGVDEILKKPSGALGRIAAETARIRRRLRGKRSARQQSEEEEREDLQEPEEKRVLGENEPEWKPFVAPFVTDSSTALVDGRQREGEGDESAGHAREAARLQMQLTPRLVSYFEVNILPREDGDRDDEDGGDFATPNGNNDDGGDIDKECVAVGLGTRAFRLHTRMPGWDNNSYGYHGDDGGIFHNTGRRMKEYGPKFGANDVVGCGLDYQRGKIFYTLNGKFLGYAFDMTERELETDWFPVVGMDTKCLVQCNFGTDRPFLYDLSEMIHKQKDLVTRTVYDPNGNGFNKRRRGKLSHITKMFRNNRGDNKLDATPSRRSSSPSANQSSSP